jgi:hypothetical protein
MNHPRQLYQLLASHSSLLTSHIVMSDVTRRCTAHELAQLQAYLPNLSSLSHLVCRSTELYPRLYSSQLRVLDVHLTTEDEDDDELAAQMENLSSASGLRSLSISLTYNVNGIASLSLEPLECMKELESLTLLNCGVSSPEELVHVRRLTSLRTLSLDCLSEQHMLILLQDLPDCPPLQLHAVERFHDLTLETAQLLIRIPALQRVEPYSITSDALKLLAHGLPDLHTLTVDVSVVTPESGWAAVRDSLAACHQLTSLTLKSTPVKELAALLIALPPSLRKLDIRDCAGFLQSDAVFQCVTEGGLHQLEQLQVHLLWRERDQVKVEAWRVRVRACAPWVKAVMEG